MPDLDVILNRLRDEALYVSLDASRPMEIQFSLANGPGGFIPLADAESAVREGWKGGDYTYDGSTPVWADAEGDYTSNALQGVAKGDDGAWRLVYMNIQEYR